MTHMRLVVLEPLPNVRLWLHGCPINVVVRIGEGQDRATGSARVALGFLPACVKGKHCKYDGSPRELSENKCIKYGHFLTENNKYGDDHHDNDHAQGDQNEELPLMVRFPRMLVVAMAMHRVAQQLGRHRVIGGLVRVLGRLILVQSGVHKHLGLGRARSVGIGSVGAGTDVVNGPIQAEVRAPTIVLGTVIPALGLTAQGNGPYVQGTAQGIAHLERIAIDAAGHALRAIHRLVVPVRPEYVGFKLSEREIVHEFKAELAGN